MREALLKHLADDAAKRPGNHRNLRHTIDVYLLAITLVKLSDPWLQLVGRSS